MKASLCTARTRGVTLVELIVVLIVLGICCAIAIPGYRHYSISVNRSDAQRDLTGYALRLQRCFMRTRDFTAPDCALDAGTNPDATYTTTVELDRTTYTLAATPINDQAGDTSCGRFTLNQAGVRGVSGTLPAQQCWQGSGD